MLNAHVDNEGDAGGSACTFQVTLASDPTFSAPVATPACTPATVSGTASTAVTATASGLSPSTSYIYRVKAVNSNPTPSFGAPAEAFTTSAPVQPPPTVSNDPEGTVTSTTAVLNAHVDNEGDAGGSACTFQVTLASDPTFSAPVATPACTPATVSGTASTAVTATASGLSPSTSYIYRVKAVNSNPTPSFGAPAEAFTTSAPVQPPPTVSNDPEGTVTSTTAVLNAHVDNEGDAGGSACTFQVTLASDPTFSAPVATPACTPATVSGTASTAVTATASGLSPSTSYIYRVKAVNSNPTPSFGAPAEAFTTSAPVQPPPTVSNDPEGTVTSTTAVLNAHVDNEGDAGGSACTFQVTLASDPTFSAPVATPACTPATVSGTASTAVTATASGLSPSTSYIYRVKAVNSNPTPSFGAPAEAFTTSAPVQPPPTVSNDPEGTVTSTTAVLNAHVDNEGDAGGSACTFQVTLASDPTFSAPVATPACTPATVSGTASTAVTATASGLSPSTSYIYRVKAVNSNPTPSFGAPAEAFTTSAPPAEFELDVTVTGEGEVDANSGPISGCRESSGTCSSLYTAGTEVILTATSDTGNEFLGWTGCDSEPGGDCKVTMSAAKSVTAEFGPEVLPTPKFTLTVNKVGPGSGSVSCNGGACASSYPEGTTLTLAATAASGSSFAGWAGAGCSGIGSCVVTLNADTTVTAAFEADGVPPSGEPPHNRIANKRNECIAQAKATFKKAQKAAKGKKGKARARATKAASKRKANAIRQCNRRFKQQKQG